MTIHFWPVPCYFDLHSLFFYVTHSITPARTPLLSKIGTKNTCFEYSFKSITDVAQQVFGIREKRSAFENEVLKGIKKKAKF